MESDTYKTIKSSSKGIYKEKGSRFISFACRISDANEIKPILDKIRKEHHDAKHHCFAYMIGNDRKIWRANDDGEPSGTGGRPILGQINSAVLTNILIVVSRYFGGTLLGVSGLINAYRSAAAAAIENAEIVECSILDYFELRYPYISMNDVMKILKDEEIVLTEQLFDTDCKVVISVKASGRANIIERLSRIEGLNYEYLRTQ